MAYGARYLGAKVEHVPPGAKDVELRMPDGATIRGALVDASGAPMAGAWVRADFVSGPPMDIWTNNASGGFGAQTDAAGAFAVTGLPPGRYRIVHVADVNVYGAGRPVRGGDDVASGASNVRLAAGGTATISGSVVDEDGKPIADASVGATPVGGGPVAPSRTDANGAFTIRDASDIARYTVRAWKSDFVPATADDVAPGATGLALRIVRGLEASGRVLLPDGSPFAKRYVQLLLEGGDYRVSAQTDADGRFTAKALKDGVYRVEEVVSSRRYGESGVGRKCGTIKAGEKDVELKMAE
jgi:protocatechuate 3,4-dioxygenase beta subunit